MDKEATKREFIEAYFKEFERKVEFLTELEASGHDHEAQLLALVYLDGLANWLRYPSRASARNFCTVLIDFGGDEQLGLIIPRWLMRNLPWKHAPAGAKAALEKTFASWHGGEVYSTPGLLGAVSSPDDELYQWLTNEMWRGSVANAVYVSLRCSGVHGLGANHGISFSDNTWHGKVLDRIDLSRLLGALRSIAAHARQVSLTTNDWFGIV